MAYFKFLFCSYFITLFLPSHVLSRSQLKFLTEETWREMLDGEWMVEFFAPWCPACRQLEPVWQKFAEWADDLEIQVGAVDVTINPGLSGRFAITALPTIFHVKDGVFRLYRGSKRKEELISFIEDAKWHDIEPIPSWKSPDSYQMSSLAYFFKLSMFLRNIHNNIVEFGIPYWGSYIIFGVATILLGTFLGLIIVCIIDFLCPTKRPVQLHIETEKSMKQEGTADHSIKDSEGLVQNDEEEEPQKILETRSDGIDEDDTDEDDTDVSNSDESSQIEDQVPAGSPKHQHVRKRAKPKATIQ